MIENKEYKNLQELIDEVNKLGNWNEFDGLMGHFKVLGNIIMILNGFSINTKTESGLTGVMKGHFPKIVIKSIVEVCKTKFPTAEVVDREEEIHTDLPSEVCYLPFVTSERKIMFYSQDDYIQNMLQSHGFGSIGCYEDEKNVLSFIRSCVIFQKLTGKKKQLKNHCKKI